MGSLERVLKTLLEFGISGGSLCLIFPTSLRSLGFEGSGLLSLPLLDSLRDEFCLGFGPWVELLHLGFVSKWVLLVLIVGSDGGPSSSKFGLNLVGVDNSGKIGTGHHWSVESPA